jgi:2-C-methyl-D-erythritol 4-phosphate cytidylyltransferase
MKVSAIVVSAGKGQRMMKEPKKQFLLLAGKPVLCHTLDKFEACPGVDSIILVASPEDMAYCMKEIVEKYRYRKVSQVVSGGKTRQDSVKNGLDALSPDVNVVVIHDGVRPFVTGGMIEDVIRLAVDVGAAVTAVPVKDTIKVSTPDGAVRKTLDRNALWQVQTPQAFKISVIKKAYHKALLEGFYGTDDASLVERLGFKVRLLPGSYSNIKITTPEDLLLADRLAEENSLPSDEVPPPLKKRVIPRRKK